MPRKLLTGADVNSQKITSLADGTVASDAANMGQLWNLVRGQDWKASVRAATTANITLSGTQTVDAVALVAGDRCLVKDQTTASTNGIYVVSSGAWTRAIDADENYEVTASMVVPVEAGGTANGGKVFYLVTANPITIGTTALTFSVLPGGATYTPGNGVSINANVIAVVPKAGGGLAVDSGGIYIDSTYAGLAKKWSSDVPAGSTSAVITHNLGSTARLGEPMVTIKSSGEVVECDIFLGLNSDTLVFTTAPTSGQYSYSTAA